jgi:hypothetical protein
MLCRPRVFGGLSGYLYHRRLTPLDHCNTNITRGSRRRFSRKPTRPGTVALRDRTCSCGCWRGGGYRRDPDRPVPGRALWFALGFLGRGFGPRRSRLTQGAANTGPRRRSRRPCCNLGGNARSATGSRASAAALKCSADRRLLRLELITGAYALRTPAPVGFDRRGALLTTV